ncbi:MAG: hybrid sensor histidine kinase/response regulator [Verrucomicrobia bacterium]|nr:hybrid sensor histidine kinase/response regulator [Verrucomicrobiota bacterium]
MTAKRQKILVVDDETTQREATARALRRHNYDVEVAVDGVEALRLARTYRPDLILSDVIMPGSDGYELVAGLRRESDLASIPVILVTGEADLRGLRQGMSRGADDYLPKPFTMEELLAAVRMRFERRDLLRREAEAGMEVLRKSIAQMLPHEFRTPLVGILGVADLLETYGATAGPADMALYAGMLRKSGDRLLRLTERFLLFSQLELLQLDTQAARAREKLPMIEHGPAIEKQAVARATAVQRQGDLEVVVDEVRWRMSADHAVRVIDELVDNALKFSRPGTPVLVRSSRTGEEIHLVIRDRGCGFHAEEAKAIGAFLQFSRKVHEQQGAGLGLSIARRLVELHGGRLRIESGEGIGTVVTVAFPAE